MLSPRFLTSAPDAWIAPRPSHDACTRRHKHGPLVPMDYEEPNLLRRLFGK